MQNGKKSIKNIIIVFCILAVISTAVICLIRPKMHKPISFSVIDYFIKINSDGSATTTKHVTTTVIKEQ